jgi:hypothetical protein
MEGMMDLADYVDDPDQADQVPRGGRMDDEAWDHSLMGGLPFRHASLQ